MRILVTPLAFLLLNLGACSPPWPADEIEEVKVLLSGGPQRIQCWDSAWMKDNKEQNYPYFRDSDECRVNLKILNISADERRVTGVARCRIDSIDAEYKLSIFKDPKRNAYYGGYYCTKAQGKNLSRFPIGSITDAEGAM